MTSEAGGAGDRWIAALAALDGVGPARLRWLLSAGPPEDVWRRLGARHIGPPKPGEARVDRSILLRWSDEVRARNELPSVMATRLDGLGVEVLHGSSLPSMLAEDPDPPAALFQRGAAVGLGPRVAIVGTRRASAYGLRVARRLGAELSEAGVSVVSGLAMGIDAEAHLGSLGGHGGVVAVIGAGHDRPCPLRNRSLAERVLSSGSILSEVPPGVPSAPWRYPVRNRLIAGLAQVVVVVESASTGGSMSTVSEALIRDRSVMAVPGPLGRRSSEGCHDLLRDGAEICTGATDVLGLLGLANAGAAAGAVGVGRSTDEYTGSGLALALLEMLAEGPLTVDSAMVRTGAALSEVSALLAELEGRGMISRDGGRIRRV